MSTKSMTALDAEIAAMEAKLHGAHELERHYDREAEKLKEVYGEGVRPGWVSADIAMAEVYRDAARREAETYTRILKELTDAQNKNA